MAEREYRRLTRTHMRRAGFFAAFATRSSLWLGKDHLLSIDSTGYTEQYKRFYFRDIQAILFVASKRRAIWNWVLIIPTVLCLAWLATALSSSRNRDAGAIIAAAISASIFTVPLLINNLLGPTCACHLRTAVQTEELPPLSRVRRARKILNRIRPLIAAAQGQLAPEDISARMRGWVESPAAAPASPRAPDPSFVVDDPNAPPRSVP